MSYTQHLTSASYLLCLSLSHLSHTSTLSPSLFPPPNSYYCLGLAGMCQVLVTNPIEYIKIQYQMNVKGDSTLMGTIRELGGFKQLYKGASLCLMRDIPFSAIYFPTYAYLKASFPADKISSFVAGTVAALPAAYFVTPLDMIKTRIQTPGNNYTSIVECAKQVYIKEGIRAFFKGGDMRVLKSCPQFGITLFVYELFQ